MNALFQEYKRQTDECRVVFVDDLEVPFQIRATTFYIHDRKKEPYNRAKEKRETKKLKDYYSNEDQR